MRQQALPPSDGMLQKQGNLLQLQVENPGTCLRSPLRPSSRQSPAAYLSLLHQLSIALRSQHDIGIIDSLISSSWPPTPSQPCPTIRSHFLVTHVTPRHPQSHRSRPHTHQKYATPSPQLYPSNLPFIARLHPTTPPTPSPQTTMPPPPPTTPPPTTPDESSPST